MNNYVTNISQKDFKRLYNMHNSHNNIVLFLMPMGILHSKKDNFK